MFAKTQKLNSNTGVILSLLLGERDELETSYSNPSSVDSRKRSPGHSSKGIEKYTITQFDNNEVIYLETLNKIKLYHEQEDSDRLGLITDLNNGIGFNEFREKL